MKLRLLFIVLIVIGGIVLVALNQAPETSTIQLTECMQSDTGDCIRFPTVSGDTLNGETVTLPDFFTGEYNLVIVPFDREQQEGVIDWLPLAQELQADYAELEYYSVGALPDLSTGVRLMISGGMSLALDDAVRAVSILLYLEDQQAFASALHVDSLDQTQLLILNQQGDIVWQTSGTYSDELANTVRGQITNLMTE